MVDEVKPPYPTFPSSEFKFHIQDIIQGNIPGYTYTPIHGRATDVSTVNYNPVWDGNLAYNYPTTARTMQLSSTDARDTGTGIGARTVLIEGLNDNFDPISEILTLNGLTPVTTTKSYLRMYSIKCQSYGTNNANYGKITLGFGTVTAGNNSLPVSIAPPSQLFSQQAVYTVPRGYALISYAYNYAASATKEINIRLFIHPNALTGAVSILSNQIITLESQPTTFYEESDIEWQVISTSGNTAVGIDIQAVLVKNEFL